MLKNDAVLKVRDSRADQGLSPGDLWR